MTLGVLGGTFDPIHFGHLTTAQAAQTALQLDRVRFVPAAHPPHRTDSPRADGYHRLEMIRLAIGDEPDWEVSDYELERAGPSYTADTLAALHHDGFEPSDLFFITGADAFAEIATWHRYPAVLDAAHFVVVRRPGTSLDGLHERLPELVARMTTPTDRPDLGRPRIILIDAPTADVSSTTIRHRISRGEPIDGLVPPAVAAYIAQNQLYRTSGR
jgi:nicotinate-nucleotide adenylyltransferase